MEQEDRVRTHQVWLFMSVRSLCCYLNALRMAGQALPRSANGQPNKLAIAKACGVGRSLLYNRPELMALLESHPL